jgi:hypothetical protein
MTNLRMSKIENRIREGMIKMQVYVNFKEWTIFPFNKVVLLCQDSRI